MYLIIYIYTFIKVVLFSLHFDIEIYQQALDSIVETTEYNSINNGKKGYYVSDELLSFYTLGWFYKEELQPYMTDGSEGVILESNVINQSNKDLLELSTKKCSKTKIYFSEVKENIFFSEILVSPKKNKKYKDRPHFGKSYIYMFQLREGNVYLLGVKEIAYN